jgi:8-oxo-dGTP pyrophosphatase MutT (NUDIX family)
MDSVAIIPFLREDGRILIVVKAGFRPALFLRGLQNAPGEGAHSRSLTVEAVAGSLESGEITRQQIRTRGVRELREETGYLARPGDLFALGAGFFPSHGQCTERIHLFGVALSGKAKVPSRGDGSVNEANSWTLMIEAHDLLRRCHSGEIEDPKLEIGVLRLLHSLTGSRRGS